MEWTKDSRLVQQAAQPAACSRPLKSAAAEPGSLGGLRQGLAKPHGKHSISCSPPRYLTEPLTASEAMKNVSIKPGVDAALVGPDVLYFSRLIAKASQSHLTRIIALPVYQDMTIRNWNTTSKILALMDARTPS